MDTTAIILLTTAVNAVAMLALHCYHMDKAEKAQELIRNLKSEVSTQQDYILESANKRFKESVLTNAIDSTVKTCRRSAKAAYAKKWREKNKEYVSQYARDYYQAKKAEKAKKHGKKKA